MEFDPSWLLIGAPLVFALGWLGAKWDSRQWRREQRDAPRAYFKGLNLLLNEQQDKAIDAFIEAVQSDPDTTELHFALGNLFRRRGEHERAVRVHQHLLARADLPQAERDRAQYALAQDFFKAGLFDRAEAAYAQLKDSAFDLDASQALLSLYERSREWSKAAQMAGHLEAAGAGSFATRIAHYCCEQALEARAQQHADAALTLLQQARARAPQSGRAHVLLAQMAMQDGQPQQAFEALTTLVSANPDAFNLAASDYARAAQGCGRQEQALQQLQSLYQQRPSLALLDALALLQTQDQQRRERLNTHLRHEPSLSAAAALLEQTHAQLDASEATLVQAALKQALRPLRRYRCAACGFESQHYFWQCPGCLSWESYPPRHVEEL
ncbi:lipopolysaccharide assembly protein LapB [Roseateles sp. BYS180W]|uniref:Lipopolysaccharide assembly protein B n=1 Tax=Roseateles rivi TaxID=3299028 RepID=A0ABW7FXY9_9BURK